MNPLALFAITNVDLLDHSHDDESLQHQRLADVGAVIPLERDGRWAAAIHRWAEQDRIAAEYDERDVAHAATRAGHRPSARPATGW